MRSNGHRTFIILSLIIPIILISCSIDDMNATEKPSRPTITIDYESMTATIDCADLPYEILYSTTEADPRIAGKEYKATPFHVSEGMVITAVAKNVAGSFSETARAFVTFSLTFNSEYSSAGHRNVRISSNSVTDEIRYTVDGSTPTMESYLYSGVLYNCNVGDSIKAVSFNSYGDASRVSEYKVPENEKSKEVLFSSRYNSQGKRYVRLYLENGNGETVWYTIDGKNPFEVGSDTKQFTGMDLVLTPGTVVKAISRKEAKEDSEPTSYTVPENDKPDEVLTISSSTYYSETERIINLSPVQGVTIYYTTDGTTPTRQSNYCPGSLRLGCGTVLKAVIYKNGYDLSDVFTFTIENHPSASYRVDYYLENPETTEYDLQESKIFEGLTEIDILPELKTYTGYSTPANAPVKINPDGSTVVTFNYSVIRSNLIYGNCGDTVPSIELYYGQSAPNPPVPVREGYTFGGWFSDADLMVEYVGPLIAGETDATLFAWWTEEEKPSAYTIKESSYSYDPTSNVKTVYSYRIDKYKGSNPNVIVPVYYNNKPIVCVYDGAFANNTTLQHITVPSPIGYVGNNVFENCTNLETITLGSSVTSIAISSLSGCNSFSAFIVDGSNETLCSIDGVLFADYGDGDLVLIKAPNTISGEYTVPSFVTRISDCGFIWCHNLSKVTMSSSVTYDSTSFYECPATIVKYW